MLAALIAGKLDREFLRSPTEIEDLLTSVVFGACRYAPLRDALLPFIGKARDAHGTTLASLLVDVTTVAFEYWPSWTAKLDTVAPRLLDGGVDNRPDPSENDSSRYEPDLVLTLDRQGCAPVCILVEAKLGSGKSSHPSQTGPVTDQLGKYWIQLKRHSEAVRATPLAVVYVTRGITPPERDFRETQEELAQKEPAAAPAPLYWLSWYDFYDAVDSRTMAIQDVRKLLRERWHLVRARMTDWPVPPMFLTENTPVVTWQFVHAWPRATFQPVDWIFQEA